MKVSDTGQKPDLKYEGDTLISRVHPLITSILLAALVWLGWQQLPAPLPSQWSDEELNLIQSLSLSALPPPPPDPSNAAADSKQAAELGRQLFFDNRLSANQSISCATCHQSDRQFTDGLALARGLQTVDRNSMGLAGVAYSPWLFWDGRKDSLWSQALEPLENPLEHGSNRVQVARLISTDERYRKLYAAAFGDQSEESFLNRLADQEQYPDASPLGNEALLANWRAMTEQDRHSINIIFSNVGKALAAWQRLLLPGTSAFDEYADQLQHNPDTKQNNLLNRSELAGLRLFLGKAQCVNCHNGPLFTNNAFHNTAVLSAPGIMPAAGRSQGLRLAQADIFNCLGPYSDAEPAQCLELRFARGGDDMIGAQRTASLRNLTATAPYMHAGQLATLDDVIRHYNRADIAVLGHNEAKPLRLRAVEKRQLRAFLDTLNGPLATDPAWLNPLAPAP